MQLDARIRRRAALGACQTEQFIEPRKSTGSPSKFAEAATLESSVSRL